MHYSLVERRRILGKTTLIHAFMHIIQPDMNPQSSPHLNLCVSMKAILPIARCDGGDGLLQECLERAHGAHGNNKLL